MRLRSLFLAATALSLVFLVPKVCTASPVTWTLSGVTFSGGGTASGSFVFDADTNAFSSINITVAGSAFGDGTYTLLDPGFGSSSTLLVLVPSILADFTGTPVLAFDFTSSLTDAGGTIALGFGQGIQQCLDVPCGVSFIVDGLTGGSVVSSSASPTPEPSSLLLLGTGLLGLGPFLLRRLGCTLQIL